MTSHSPLLERVAPAVYWLMIVASAWILLRGHNAPGGGFIGGLMAVAGTALVAIVHDAQRARRLLPLTPLTLASSGVLLALISGIFGLPADEPFLTHRWWKIEVAGADLKLSTVLLFDLGVYAAVWGAFAAYLLALLDNRRTPA